ncbi:hypothetical protein NGK_p0006 (plasmid) [Neisseria gonorrhoeae NCCP11945]|uniref:Uncharacterized protein n=1 Tax=Neisseria gonorrhoeae (strain NCCP11945) TaxID=521006 RepID=B4RRG1_NEIG2|nr:hypothetical protein NGK_p0006 [Neisseria gonorrhoeae NCCP11945]
MPSTEHRGLLRILSCCFALVVSFRRHRLAAPVPSGAGNAEVFPRFIAADRVFG